MRISEWEVGKVRWVRLCDRQEIERQTDTLLICWTTDTFSKRAKLGVVSLTGGCGASCCLIAAGKALGSFKLRNRLKEKDVKCWFLSWTIQMYIYSHFLFVCRRVYNRFGVVTSFTGTYKADEWSLALSSPQGTKNYISFFLALCYQ